VTPVWTILIATLGCRQHKLGNLLEGLLPQVEAAGGQVTIEALWNNRERSCGLVRQDLLDHATAEYVCFVDDDDRVAASYVAKILPLLDGVDYVGFDVDVDVLGQPGIHRRASHSLRHAEWDDDTLSRHVSHLNPVRRELARKVPFPDLGYREDNVWAHAMREHLDTEHYLDEIMYFYTPAGETTAEGQPPPDRRPHSRLPVGSPYFSWNPASSQEGLTVMTWVLSAVGDCPADDEASLVADLQDVLSQYGTTSSQLGGESVNGPVHEKPAPKKDKSD